MSSDQGNRAHRIVVPRNGIVHFCGVTISINNCHNWNTKFFSFSYCNLFLFNINNKQNLRQLFHLFDAAKELIQTFNFSSQHQRFSLSLCDHCVFGKGVFKINQPFNPSLDGLKIRHHSTQPSLVDVHGANFVGLFFNCTLSLGLRPDQQTFPTFTNNRFDKFLSGV